MPNSALSTFSIVVITYNEEQNIERCLSSLQALTDDLVVVDSGSNDNTVAICEKFGARVFIHPFVDFANQKNYAIRKAKYDWIVAIDADEQIDETLRNHLSILDLNDKEVVYLFDRKTNYCGKWIRFSGLRHDYIARVFNREMYQWKGVVHETIYPEPKKVKCIKGRLNHFTYRHIDDHFQVALKYSRIQAHEYALKGKKIRWYHLWISPAVRFIKHYFLKFGFLDGFEGYLIAKFASLTAFSKYSRAKWLSNHPEFMDLKK
jgi:glycosyltransferase involved in cell wall biosynthesis